MHFEAKERKSKQKLRTKRTASIEGIAERGANEEEDAKLSRSTFKSPGMGSIATGSIPQFTSSNMNLMQKKLNGSFIMDDQLSLTQIECNYLLSVLKNRAI